METSFDNEDGFSSGEEEDYMGRNDMSDGSELDDEQSEGEVDVAGPTNCDPPLSLAGPKQPSLYLMENAKKKVVLKDGKLVAASRQKAQRKDKGVGKTKQLGFKVFVEKNLAPFELLVTHAIYPPSDKHIEPAPLLCIINICIFFVFVESSIYCLQYVV